MLPVNREIVSAARSCKESASCSRLRRSTTDRILRSSLGISLRSCPLFNLCIECSARHLFRLAISTIHSNVTDVSARRDCSGANAAPAQMVRNLTVRWRTRVSGREPDGDWPHCVMRGTSSRAEMTPGQQLAAAMRSHDFDRAWELSDRVLRELDDQKHVGPRHLQQIWRGERLENARVLVRCYHGLGDAIQFIRFAEPLRKIAREVTVWCQPELQGLLRRI